jgi:molybdopterin-guanine dinucleotide biosynthesis protein A
MNGRKAMIAALLVGAAAAACTATADNPKLSSKYEYTIGDDVAQRTANILRITAGIEEPTLVYYDRDNHDVVAEIIGNTDNVEGAKREIEALLDVIRADVVGYAKKQHKLDLTDNDVTLIYYVDSDQGVPEEVVRREKGKYLVPKVEEQEKE